MIVYMHTCLLNKALAELSFMSDESFCDLLTSVEANHLSKYSPNVSNKCTPEILHGYIKNCQFSEGNTFLKILSDVTIQKGLRLLPSSSRSFAETATQDLSLCSASF